MENKAAVKVLMRGVVAASSVVMADVGKYIEHIEEEERRSHPFGVTNVLLNGLNGRKSKNNLETGRSLTWICFFCLILGICVTVIFLSARSANDAKKLNCTDYNIGCDDLPLTTSIPTTPSDPILRELNKRSATDQRQIRPHKKLRASIKTSKDQIIRT